MKLVLYNDYRLGVLRDQQVVDAMSALEGLHLRRPQDLMEEVITGWTELKPKIEFAIEGKEAEPADSVRLRAPVPRPRKLICAAVNYLEFGQREPAVLDAFLKSPTAIIGSGDTCELPPAPATIFHHEPELALVIGKTASKISQDDAMSHVFGYTNFLDMSARGLQGAVGNSFFLGKCWDTFAPMGPALVTADEIDDPQNLKVRLWNNNEPRHDFPTSDMAHKIPELISEFSKVTTLEPGDVIATGVNHQQIGAVQDGDELRMEIEGLGPPLIIYISDPSKREWPRGIDTEMAARVIAAAPLQ
ncbi:MAG: fumarylacetoacetate hydrolase family protein [Dehalococcoidia bacterium]|jgi:2-keto-4-pentenoate hydratase/2-oxohepta-3-ene-1,7-dioic acid hydratase in catechol pathway|nr:fumarylacetoacetate hydrolase family protein [Dehalococcoidia bacterium]